MQGPVGLEDLVVQVGVAVVFLGDLRERVALDHGVVAGLGSGRGHQPRLRFKEMMS